MILPKVSIVINNYNYESFLGEAIESALDQTYANKEIIVVDDGSTDNSKRVIENFSESIKAVYKENGGQGSAFNEGLKHVEGAIVAFLDADDVLAPSAIEQVVDTFETNQKLVCVRWRLALIDEDGCLLGASNPAKNLDVPTGDLMPSIIENGWRYPTPPTSGNAFLTSVLKDFFPIPAAIRRCCDVYLFGNTPMRGAMAFIPEELGYYRQHVAKKNHFRLNQRKVVEELGAADVTDQSVARFICEKHDPAFDVRAAWGLVGDEVLRFAVYRFAKGADVGSVLPPINCVKFKKNWSVSKKIKWMVGVSIIKLSPSEKVAYWMAGVMLKKHNIFGAMVINHN